MHYVTGFFGWPASVTPPSSGQKPPKSLGTVTIHTNPSSTLSSTWEVVPADKVRQRWRTTIQKVIDASRAERSAAQAKQLAIQQKWRSLARGLKATEQRQKNIETSIKAHRQGILTSLKAMKSPNQLCETYGLPHLVTPASLESQLRREKTDQFSKLNEFYTEGLALRTYAENHALFDEAAKELVYYFYCVAPNPPKQTPGEEPEIKHENTHFELACFDQPLYSHLIPHIEKTATNQPLGNLLLIDSMVSHFYTCRGSLVDACRHAIRYCPYQLDGILMAAREIVTKQYVAEAFIRGTNEADATQQAKTSSDYIALSRYLKSFQSIQAASFTYLNEHYLVHRAFATKNAITPSHPTQLLGISEKRAQQVQASICAALQQLHLDDPDGGLEGCLGKEPEKTMQLFEAEFPKILDILMSRLQATLTLNITQHAECSPLSDYPHLLLARTVAFPTGFAIRDLKPHFKMLEGGSDCAKWIIQHIFEALSTHEIAACYPHVGRLSRLYILC